MTSMFDFDDSVNMAFDAKFAGKSLVAAKHDLLTRTGDFFFLAHSDRELAQRMRMVEEDIEKVAYHKLANVSDSKAKLVRAIYDEWQLRHASCEMCKVAAFGLAPGTGKAMLKDHAAIGAGELAGGLMGAGLGTLIAPGAGSAAGFAGGAAVGGYIGEALNKSHYIKKDDQLHKDLDAQSRDYNSDQHTDAEHHPDHPETVHASRRVIGAPAGTDLPGNLIGGFCHGCASALGAGAAGLAGLALLGSKHAADNHEIFCDNCKANPNKINCNTCKQ